MAHAIRHFEQSLAALAHTELTPAEKVTLIHVVDDYVHGSVLQSAGARAAAAAPMDDAAVEEAIRYTQAQLQTGEFPRTRALLATATLASSFGSSWVTGPHATGSAAAWRWCWSVRRTG